MSAELIAFASNLRGLDRDTLYSMWRGAIRQAAREREADNHAVATVWDSFAGVLGARYEEMEKAA